MSVPLLDLRAQFQSIRDEVPPALMEVVESQQFIIRELYDIPASALIDFDRFTIPFEGPFDLIVCNHMFNHAVRLDGFLSTLRAALKPGGHLYLYNEIDDSEFLGGTQSMIATIIVVLTFRKKTKSTTTAPRMAAKLSQPKIRLACPTSYALFASSQNCDVVSSPRMLTKTSKA